MADQIGLEIHRITHKAIRRSPLDEKCQGQAPDEKLLGQAFPTAPLSFPTALLSFPTALLSFPPAPLSFPTAPLSFPTFLIGNPAKGCWQPRFHPKMAQQLRIDDPARIQNYALTLSAIQYVERDVFSKTKADRVGIPGLAWKRAVKKSLPRVPSCFAASWKN